MLLVFEQVEAHWLLFRLQGVQQLHALIGLLFLGLLLLFARLRLLRLILLLFLGLLLIFLILFLVLLLILFLIVFLWQFSHFLAIAWIYRDDYTRAGYKMLPTVDPRGAMTGRQAAGYALALIPAGLLPTVVGLAGAFYFAGALALGAGYLYFAVRFWSRVNDLTARHLLRASFVYLPAILMLLLLNPMPA